LDGQHYLVKIPARDFKAGDAIVLRVLSPYRTISAAIILDGKAGQVPVKKPTGVSWEKLRMQASSPLRTSLLAKRRSQRARPMVRAKQNAKRSA
jgi:hypothetical protein